MTDAFVPSELVNARERKRAAEEPPRPDGRSLSMVGAVPVPPGEALVADVATKVDRWDR